MYALSDNKSPTVFIAWVGFSSADIRAAAHGGLHVERGQGGLG